MNFKFDTKEKFTVVMPQEPHIYDNMAADLAATSNQILEKEVKNIILDMQSVSAIDDGAATAIAELQQGFYDKNISFVICSMQETVEAVFEKLELLDFLNSTPTESEAWDIVQMEEIERELMDSDDFEFEAND